MFLFLTQAIFQRFAGYTGTSLHESWSLSLFNTLFSSLAVICLGSFEQDLMATTLLAVPELYETSRCGRAFNIRTFIAWMLLAAIQAVGTFYLSYYALAASKTNDLFSHGNLVFTAIIVILNVKLIFLEMHSWSVLNYSFFTVSFLGWWFWSVLQAAIYKSEQAYFVKDNLFAGFGTDLSWWSTLLLVILSILLLDIAGQALWSSFYPTEEDCFRELQTDVILQARLKDEVISESQVNWIEDILEQRGSD